MVVEGSNVDIEGLDEFLEDPRFRAALEDADARRRLMRGLVKQRKTAGFTQRDVAEHMETTQSFVSELENGQTDPHLSTLQRYARAVTAKLEIKIALPPDCTWQMHPRPQALNTWTESGVFRPGSRSTFESRHVAMA